MLLSLASDTSLVSSSMFLPLFLSLGFCLLLFFSFVSLSLHLLFSFHFHSSRFCSQMSHSSQFSSSSETQDLTQMGLLINSRLPVTHFSLEREMNACTANSTAVLPALETQAAQKILLQEGRTLFKTRIYDALLYQHILFSVTSDTGT